MEYANRNTWKVVAYDLQEKPILMQEKLAEWVAKRIQDRWFARADIIKVDCYDAETVGR